MKRISKKQRIAIVILIVILVITIIANVLVISMFNQWETNQSVSQQELLEQSSEYQAYTEITSK